MTTIAERPQSSAGVPYLILATVVIVAAGRLVEGPLAWGAAILLAVSVGFGALQVFGEAGPASELGVPIESVIAPAAAAFAAFGSIRIVPIGILLVPALAVVAWAMRRVVATEARILRARIGPSSADRTAVLAELVAIGFVGFVGIAALVPGGLPEVGGEPGLPPTGPQLAILAAADGLFGFALGYRAAALRSITLRDVAWAALTSGGIVGIAAAAIRAIDVPRLLGPALLTVIFFLWDTIHASAPLSRRDPRRLWEAVLLIVLAAVVTLWSLRLRG